MNMHSSLFLLSIISTTFSCSALTSLTDLQHYAQAYTENPVIDNTVWTDPNYSTFHRQNLPNIVQKIGHFLGYHSSWQWYQDDFKKLLEKVTIFRETQKLQGRKVAYFHAHDGAHFVIWGDLRGAFHSWVRCLEYLKILGIIDEQLAIIKPDYYFVFNGDLINGSAYTLETLTLALLLMDKNPDKVFYLRGKHEDHEYWKNFSLKPELTIRAFSVSNETIPLESLVNRFFQTLPLALYISVKDAPKEVICISHTAKDDPEINIQMLGDLFAESSLNTLRYYALSDKQSTKNPVDVKVIIEAENLGSMLQPSPGLKLLQSDEGAIAWSVLSSPTPMHQKYLGMVYDAFAILTVENPIEQSTITLYNHHINTPDPFKKVGVFNIILGSELPEESAYDHVSIKDDILIGSTLPLKDDVPFTTGHYIMTGMLDRINNQNALGGINGHPLRAIIYGDSYTAYTARKNVRRLLSEWHCDLIFLPVGSTTIAGYLNLIEQGKVHALFPVTGKHNPEFKNILYLRPSYADEARMLIDFMIDTYSVEKFAFLYQNNAVGEGPLRGAREQLKKRGIKEWTEIPYTPGTVNFDEQAKRLEEAQAEAIGFFGTSQVVRYIIESIGVDSIASKFLFGYSFLGSASFHKYIGQRGLQFIFSSVVPNPNTSDLPIVKHYREAMDKRKQPYDVYSLEGYIGTTLLIQALQDLKDKPYTSENIFNYFQSVKNLNFMGMEYSFNAKTRTLARQIWIDSGDDVEWAAKNIP